MDPSISPRPLDLDVQLHDVVLVAPGVAGELPFQMHVDQVDRLDGAPLIVSGRQLLTSGQVGERVRRVRPTTTAGLTVVVQAHTTLTDDPEVVEHLVAGVPVRGYGTRPCQAGQLDRPGVLVGAVVRQTVRERRMLWRDRGCTRLGVDIAAYEGPEAMHQAYEHAVKLDQVQDGQLINWAFVDGLLSCGCRRARA